MATPAGTVLNHAATPEQMVRGLIRDAEFQAKMGAHGAALRRIDEAKIVADKEGLAGLKRELNDLEVRIERQVKVPQMPQGMY